MMIVHPDIAMLRSDIASQHRIAKRMQLAHRQWVQESLTLEIARDLRLFADGSGIGNCAALSNLLNDHGEAMRFTRLFTGAVLNALREEPLGEVPCSYRCSSGFSRMQLLQAGGATINLVVYERLENAAVQAPQSALFADCESVEMVLCGAGKALLHTLHERPERAAKVTSELVTLKAADRLTLQGIRQARQIISADGMLVLLQVSKVPECPKPSREFRLSDGALLQAVSGNKAASQRLMALAVLGSLKGGSERKYAALNRSALDRNEDAEVRWEAVRQTLALDAHQGLELLKLCSGDDGDPLARPARDLRARFFETEPV